MAEFSVNISNNLEIGYYISKYKIYKSIFYTIRKYNKQIPTRFCINLTPYQFLIFYKLIYSNKDSKTTFTGPKGSKKVMLIKFSNKITSIYLVYENNKREIHLSRKELRFIKKSKEFEIIRTHALKQSIYKELE